MARRDERGPRPPSAQRLPRKGPRGIRTEVRTAAFSCAGRIGAAGADEAGSNGGIWDDVQIRPNANSVLVSRCGSASCEHALYSLTDGTVIQTLPQLTNNRAKFSPEGNWVVSGTTLLHLPDGQQRVLDPAAVLAAFVPDGDVIALLADNTLARYCRSQ